jgi:hypothetical protein
MRETAIKKLFANFTKKRILTALAIFLFVLLLYVLIWFVYEKSRPFPVNSSVENIFPAAPRAYHEKTPDVVKGIYLTAHTAGISRFDELLELVKNTELNTMVIDVKDSNGNIAFNVRHPGLAQYSNGAILVKDLEKLIEKAHAANIYLIARVVVFQDQAFVKKHPEWAVKNSSGGIWRDYNGVAWLDPACTDVWNYNVALAKELYVRGFDEINFDYVRFPSDGNIAKAVYPCWKGTDKAETIKSFFNYLSRNLSGIPVSADLFGQTCCNLDDINIGQKIVDAYENIDAVCQMMYPSHYFTNFDGFKNPADHPYEVVKYSLDKTFEKINEYLVAASSTLRNAPVRHASVRPWIQAFSLGAIYTPEMIRKQMQAVYDTPNTGGWLLWNARNVYSEKIFLKE